MYRFWLLECLKLIAPPLVEDFIQIANPNYNLRNKREFKSQNFKIASFGTEPLDFLDPKIWDKIPNYLKSLISLSEFK